MASTITIAQTIEWSKKFNFGRVSTIGNNIEPALTSANIVLQTMIGPPFEWRWNRQEYSWTCVDSTVVWQANTAYALGFHLQDSNGNMQTVTATGAAPHQSGATVPTWSTDTNNNGTTTDGNLTWTCTSIDTYLQVVPNFGWIEHASVQDTTDAFTPHKWYEMEQKLSLAHVSEQGRPRFISAHTDDNAGNIGFVLMPLPNKPYPISMHIQKKATLITSTASTWSPIPDEFSYIYNWGFLALMWMFADDPRFAVANQKFVTHLLSANEGLSETQKNIFLNKWSALTGADLTKEQQGIQARGV